MEFLTMDWLGTPVWFWLAFLSIVITLTAFDLGILHKEDKEMGIAESLKLSAFYISIAMLFGLWVWFQKGADMGMKYYTGFFIEKALSIDNVFVISLIFTFFAIPRKYQYRALLWGIIAVIVLRGLMIAAGAAIVQEYYWTLYIFAVFLVGTGIKMLFTGDQEMDVAKNPVVKYISTHMRVTKELHAEKFFVKVPDEKTGKMVRAATPLFLALVVINLADLCDHHRYLHCLYVQHHGHIGPACFVFCVGSDGPSLPLSQIRSGACFGLHWFKDLRVRLPAGWRQIPARLEPWRYLRPYLGRHPVFPLEDQG
jgi:tellurite resistance protein TerC